jgi:hypothetical protein
MGIDVRLVPLLPDRLGDCTRTDLHIWVDTHDEATFFHELAHAAHARVKGKLKGAQDGQQETVTELTAAVLMELYGLRDHTGNAWHHIGHYHADPLTAICQAVGEVEQVLGVLLAWAPEPMVAQEAVVCSAS